MKEQTVFADYFKEVLGKAGEGNTRDTLTFSKHIWHQIVTNGTEESYLIVAVTFMAASMKRFLPDENIFPGDLLTSLMDQSRAGSKKAHKLAVDMIHAQLSRLVVDELPREKPVQPICRSVVKGDRPLDNH